MKTAQLPTTNYQLLTTKPALLAIVGPTASGKSGLAMKLAKQFNGEIICADSLTVYKNMDIGTAKPTKADQAAVKHWALDIIGPSQRYTAAEFKKYAQAKILAIQNRGKLPVLVGGTGLYADSVLYDFQFSFQDREHDPVNPRHLKPSPDSQYDKTLRPGTFLVGLLPPDDELKTKISQRAEQMFKEGLMDETKGLIRQYGVDSLLSKAKVAYGPSIACLLDGIDENEAKNKLKTAHWQYARRQKTWFKRNEHIKWFASADEAYKAVKKVL